MIFVSFVSLVWVDWLMDGSKQSKTKEGRGAEVTLSHDEDVCIALAIGTPANANAASTLGSACGTR